MVLKISCIRILWLTVSYVICCIPVNECSSSNHVFLVAILDVLSEVQEFAGAWLPKSEDSLLLD